MQKKDQYLKIKIVRQGQWAVAIPLEKVSPMTQATVNRALRQIRDRGLRQALRNIDKNFSG